MDYDYESNPYYHPEKHDMSVLHEIDNAGSYEFNTMIVWQKPDGSLYWAHDSGCSCPTPFESCDITPLTLDTYHDFKACLESNYNRSHDLIVEMETKVKEALLK